MKKAKVIILSIAALITLVAVAIEGFSGKSEDIDHSDPKQPGSTAAARDAKDKKKKEEEKKVVESNSEQDAKT